MPIAAFVATSPVSMEGLIESMTTPTERTRAVIELAADLRRFLTAYANGSGETVRVHRNDLRQLAGWLRHYPMPHELDTTAEALPQLWGKPDSEH